ncbi:MAG: universal stress protein, partial [Polaribacter sp.]
HPFLKNKKTVEYVFSKGDDIIKNISNYLLKSNINLLFINREEKNTKSTNLALKEVINKLDCSLILTT